MIKSWEEMRKIDISEYVKERDGMSYLPWATCLLLLRTEGGAQSVEWHPVVNAKTGNSLFYSEFSFEDKDHKTNRAYEVVIELIVDGEVSRWRFPLMSGGKPVKDSWLNQQVIWNAQCRAFVKGVAIKYGLGFDLWLAEAKLEEDNEAKELDLSKHSIMAIKQRLGSKITEILLKKEISKEELAGLLNKTEDELRTICTYPDQLYRLEEELNKIE